MRGHRDAEKGEGDKGRAWTPDFELVLWGAVQTGLRLGRRIYSPLFRFCHQFERACDLVSANRKSWE